MKKQWYRVATVTMNTDSAAADWTEVQKRRAALLEKPESRDRLAALVRSLMQSGSTEEAQKLATQWLEKDAMDAEALVIHAELALLRGDAARAMELLESAIDANPGSEAAHERLLGAHLALGDFQMMCAHAVTRALVAPKNWEHQATAAQCTQDAARFFAHLPAGQRAQAERKLKEEARPTLRRDALNLEATWEGDSQVDLVVVTPEGRVVSFAGGARRVHTLGAQSTINEQLSTSMEKRGRYQIFAVPRRVSGTPAGQKTAAGSARGQVKISSYNASRTIPFTVGSAPVRVADVVVSSTFRLVPAGPSEWD
jgi:tetratricopeptide (TPR) repeat protein